MSQSQETNPSAQDEAELQALLQEDASTDAPVTEPVAETPADATKPTAEQAQAIADEVKVEPEIALPKGDARAALRASRRSEHRLRQDVNRLQDQLKQAQAAIPAEVLGDDDLSAEDLEQAADFPLVAKLMRQNKALAEKVNAIAAQTQNPSNTAEAEFLPPTLPPELQDVVDDIPQLLQWQNDPDQAAFELAKIEDQKLLLIPKWQGVTTAERFAEVTRRVAAELSDDAPAPAPAPTPAPAKRFDVDQQISMAARVRPNTLNDIGGGGGDTPKADSTLSRFQTMSDEEMVNELLSS